MNPPLRSYNAIKSGLRDFVHEPNILRLTFPFHSVPAATDAKKRWPDGNLSALWRHLLAKDCALMDDSPPFTVTHIVRVRGACYGRGSGFRLKRVLNDGPPRRKIRRKFNIFFCVLILVARLGPRWDFFGIR